MNSPEHPLRPYLYDFIDTLSDALAKPGGVFDLKCHEAFGRSPLVAIGNWFGTAHQLTEKHAPFAAVWPGEAPADIELLRDGIIACRPRAFSIRLAIGFDIGAGRPVPPLPAPCDGRSAPVLYNGLAGRVAEETALAAVSVATTVFSAFGFMVSACEADYDGAAAWPLEVFNFSLSFGAVRTVQTGAY